MNFLDIFKIFIYLIILICLGIIILKYNKISNTIIDINKRINNYITFSNNIKITVPYDTIFHISTETLTFDGIYSVLLKYDSDIINLHQCYFKSQLVSYQAKMDYDDIPPIHFNSNNYIHHINNKYIEMFFNDMYFGLSKNKFMLIDKIKYYEGNLNNEMIIGSFKRLEDDKEFIYVSMSQKYNTYLHESRYKGISQLINTIKYYYPDKPYIIVGDFNVQGHEEIFKFLLNDALVCNVYKDICTCNDNEGLASPDGLVVSNKLYKKIEYEIDFFKGFSVQHYPLMAKLYIRGNNEVINVTNNGFIKNIKKYVETTTRENYINNKGVFDSKLHNITELCKENSLSNLFLKKNNEMQIAKKNRN